MLRITPSKIVELTTLEIYRKGERFFEEGRVRSFSLKGEGEINARVGDETQKNPTVHITLSSRGIRGFCTCSRQNFCEHMVSVLLYYCGNQESPLSPGEILEEMNKLAPALGEDRRINLEESKNYNKVLKKEMALLFSPIEAPGEHSLVLELIDTRELLFRPMIGVISDSRAPRGIEKLKDRKLKTPLSPGETSLLKQCKGEDIKLSRIIDLIDHLGQGQFTFVVQRGRDSHYLKLLPFRRTILHFKLVDLFEEKVPLFRPLLELLGEHDQRLQIVEDFSLPLLEEEGIFSAALPDNMIAYHLSNPYLVELFRFFKTQPLNWCPRDIKNLESRVPESLKPFLSLRLPAGELKIRNVLPRPCLMIDEGKDELFLKLIFTYHYYEIPFYSSEEYVSDPLESLNRGLTVFKRNREYEQKVYDYLWNYFYRAGKEEFSQALTEFEQMTYSFSLKMKLGVFIGRHSASLMDGGVDIKIGADRVKTGKGKVSFRVASGIDWLNIKTFLSSGDEFLDLTIDEELIVRGMVLTGKGYVLLDPEDQRLLLNLAGEGMNNQGELKTSPLNFSLVDLIYEKVRNREQDWVKKSRELMEQFRAFKGLPSALLPRGFTGSLREYQREGYNWLQFLGRYNLGGCLADDMGLGKTVQTLVLLQYEKEQGAINPSLLVLPVVTLVNWEEEIKRFTPELSFYRHSGAKRHKEELPHADLILVSYNTLRIDIELFHRREFHYLILDEAQNIKNPQSQSFKALCSLKARHRLALTGTPVENSSLDLWAQMEFLNPGILGSKRLFKDLYIKPIEQEDDRDAAKRLKSRVAPFILRRTKSEVLAELPEKEEILYYVEMEEQQKDLYETLKKEYRDEILARVQKEGVSRSSIHIFSALSRLRQLVLFPALVDEKYESIPSCKFEALQGLVEDIVSEKNKALLFSQFVRSLDKIRTWCDSRSFAYSWITGDTKKRGEEISRFQEGEVPLFLLSLKAGGVGINLTAADYVILFDPWWNPAVENQAIDRAHRIGRKEKVLVYKMIVRDTIEEKILSLQQKKSDLVGQLIAPGGGVLKSITLEDLEGLFL